MTYEEAFNEVNMHCCWCECKVDDNTKILILETIEKQIPKKPIENRYPWVICPSCGGSVYIDKVQEHIRDNENTYCEHCGQALDWGVNYDR